MRQPGVLRSASLVTGIAFLSCSFSLLPADEKEQPRKRPARQAEAQPEFPPQLPGGKTQVTVTSEAFLKAPETIKKEVEIAKAVPTIDIMYFPGQDYPGNPWSVWGDGTATAGKYYTGIGDHIGPAGNGFVFEYDATTKSLRKLTDIASLLKLPEGHYVPGKIHSRVDLGSDGRIYFSTHRGSTRVTTDEYHYKGDWIIAHDPKTGESEIIAHGPVPKHCLPTSVLDPERLLFYAGTASADPQAREIHFLAYDIRNRKVLYSGPNGPARYIMFAPSTGRVYYTPGVEGKSEGPVMRYDPASAGPPVQLETEIGLRSATAETPQGIIYTVSQAPRGEEAMIYAFDTKTETATRLGSAAVGTQNYITSIDADPTGRYLYYIPGAHGGSELDGSPVVQYDVKTGRKKVLAFLHPYCQDEFGATLKGTFSSAVDAAGDKLYVTWNNSRGTRVWDSCVLTVIHIPASERTLD